MKVLVLMTVLAVVACTGVQAAWNFDETMEQLGVLDTEWTNALAKYDAPNGDSTELVNAANSIGSQLNTIDTNLEASVTPDQRRTIAETSAQLRRRIFCRLAQNTENIELLSRSSGLSQRELSDVTAALKSSNSLLDEMDGSVSRSVVDEIGRLPNALDSASLACAARFVRGSLAKSVSQRLGRESLEGVAAIYWTAIGKLMNGNSEVGGADRDSIANVLLGAHQDMFAFDLLGGGEHCTNARGSLSTTGQCNRAFKAVGRDTPDFNVDIPFWLQQGNEPFDITADAIDPSRVSRIRVDSVTAFSAFSLSERDTFNQHLLTYRYSLFSPPPFAPPGSAQFLSSYAVLFHIADPDTLEVVDFPCESRDGACLRSEDNVDVKWIPKSAISVDIPYSPTSCRTADNCFATCAMWIDGAWVQDREIIRGVANENGDTMNCRPTRSGLIAVVPDSQTSPATAVKARMWLFDYQADPAAATKLLLDTGIDYANATAREFDGDSQSASNRFDIRSTTGGLEGAGIGVLFDISERATLDRPSALDLFLNLQRQSGIPESLLRSLPIGQFTRENSFEIFCEDRGEYLRQCEAVARSAGGGSNNAAIIIAVVAGVLAAIAICVGAAYYYNKNKQEGEIDDDEDAVPPPQSQPREDVRTPKDSATTPGGIAAGAEAKTNEETGGEAEPGPEAKTSDF